LGIGVSYLSDTLGHEHERHIYTFNKEASHSRFHLTLPYRVFSKHHG